MAIFWSVLNTNKKVTPEKNNQSEQKTELKKDDGMTVEVRNIYGQVRDWQPESGILKILVDKDDIEDFQINPLLAKVMVPMSRQGQTSDQFYIFKKASGPHWETAFCLGDNASLQVNNEGKVEVAVNDGNRMCGYMGAWE